MLNRKKFKLYQHFYLSQKRNKDILKKIKNGTKVANVFIGEVDFLDEVHDDLVVFMRLAKPVVLDVSEVVLPTKFVFIYLSKV